MNPVEYHLKLTIYLWTGAAPSSYKTASLLRDIWNVPGEAYEPIGIQKFMHQMYLDRVFGHCTTAHNITANRFFATGDLQTFDDLYEVLLGCEDDAGATAIADRIVQSAPPAPGNLSQ